MRSPLVRCLLLALGVLVWIRAVARVGRLAGLPNVTLAALAPVGPASQARTRQRLRRIRTARYRAAWDTQGRLDRRLVLSDHPRFVALTGEDSGSACGIACGAWGEATGYPHSTERQA